MKVTGGDEIFVSLDYGERGQRRYDLIWLSTHCGALDPNDMWLTPSQARRLSRHLERAAYKAERIKGFSW